MDPVLVGLLASVGYIVGSWTVVGLGLLYIHYTEPKGGSNTDDRSVGA